MSEQDGGGVEAEAKTLGWVPKEDFRGNPEKWVEAEAFVERGKAVMPILRKNNEKLLTDVNSLRGEIQTLKGALNASAEAMESLKEFQNEHTQRKVKEARAELIRQLTAAREDGNVEAEVKITDELASLRVAENVAAEKPAEKVERAVDYTQEPYFKSWSQQNEWFGTDRRKTALAVGIAEEIRQSEPNLFGEAFLRKVADEVNATLGGAARQGKVEGARSGAGQTGAKSYADLPADAKAACVRQSERLVGPNRAFKTQADWQKHYVASYFGE